MTKLGCAAITWGNVVTQADMENMLREMKECGYDGVELGVQALPLIGGSLTRLGLELVAGHAGGDYRNVDEDAAVDAMMRDAEAVKALGGRFMFLSGCNFQGKSADDYRKEAELYNRFGRAVHETGLQLCYHNHHWEFKKKRLGLSILMDNTDPALLKLVPDIGWVTRGDEEPTEFVSEFEDRIAALHFKEFTYDDHFTELGKGIVDFSGVYQWAVGRGLWIVAEQDISQSMPIDSARQNATFLRSLIDQYGA